MSEHITREQANELLHKYVKGENYITHSYAVEAIMMGLAKKLLQVLADAAIEENVKIKPVCSFVVKQFEENKEYEAIKA